MVVVIVGTGVVTVGVVFGEDDSVVVVVVKGVGVVTVRVVFGESVSVVVVVVTGVGVVTVGVVFGEYVSVMVVVATGIGVVSTLLTVLGLLLCDISLPAFGNVLLRSDRSCIFLLLILFYNVKHNHTNS